MTNATAVLRVSSVLSMLLLTIHVTDDIVRGFDRFGYSAYVAIVVSALLLCGTLLGPGRKWGLVCMLLIGIIAAAMPAIHMRGRSWPTIPQTEGGFLFIWTLWALGISGMLSILLAVGGLLRRAPRIS